jgi:hypothetical protein
MSDAMKKTALIVAMATVLAIVIGPRVGLRVG